MVNLKKIFSIAIGTTIFVSLSVDQAKAIGIELTTNTKYIKNGVLQLEDPKSASGGTIGSLVQTSDGATIDFSNNAFANAVNFNGITAVQANGVFFSPLPGQTSPDELITEATLSEYVTNNTGTDQSYNYDFFIPGAELLIVDFVFGPDAEVSYNFKINVEASGVSTNLFSSQATLLGGGNGFTLSESGTNLNKTFTCFFAGCNQSNPGNTFGFTFDPFSGDIDLGTYSDGESFKLEVILETRVAALPFELGGFAAIGDPGNIGANGGALGSISSQPTTPEPIPEPLTLFGSFTALGLGTIFKKRLSSTPNNKSIT